MELRYIAPGGTEYQLLAGSDGGPFIAAESLTGLVGVFEDTPVSVVGVPGGRVDFRDRVVKPMEGGFQLVVFSTQQWRQARRDFSTRQPGLLMLTGEHQFELPVRLSAPLPAPSTVPSAGTALEVALIADGGVWLSSAKGTGAVTVTNWGDAPVWPKVVFSGVGKVVLPSGAQVSLPAVTGEHVLDLSRGGTGAAVNVTSGSRVPVDAVAEMVPVGATRTFHTEGPARLEWKIGVFDPWI